MRSPNPKVILPVLRSRYIRPFPLYALIFGDSNQNKYRYDNKPLLNAFAFRRNPNNIMAIFNIF